MEKVAVLLSTYNGESYLEEQLDSILTQQNVDMDIFIRDDGSIDKTKEILNLYNDKYKNIYVFYSQNVGVGNSFMNLLYSVPDEYDFYSLADQDDIWEADKIMKAIMLLKEKNALLYASNQECVDKDGITLGLRYCHNERINLNPIGIMQRNMLAGCTMVFTRYLFQELIKENHRPSEELLRNRIHDVWIAMAASLYKGIVYDKNAFIKYRQHDNNVVGAYTNGMFSDIKLKWNKIFNSNERNGRSKLAYEVIRKFPERCCEQKFLKVCAYPKKCRNKIYLIKHKDELLKYSSETSLGLIVKILFNFF